MQQPCRAKNRARAQLQAEDPPMDNPTASYPTSASIYELVRLRPSVRPQLEHLGVTDEYLGYRISEAARAVGVPASRIAAIVEREMAATH